MVGKSHDCPVLRPSRKEFLAPFTEYISNYFKENPDVPVIKVVPPQGYRPRHTEYPTDLRIDTPIQQNVSRDAIRRRSSSSFAVFDGLSRYRSSTTLTERASTIVSCCRSRYAAYSLR